MWYLRLDGRVSFEKEYSLGDGKNLWDGWEVGQELVGGG